MPTGKITKTEIKLLQEKASRIFFDSSFLFLRGHNGFRPGSLHTFIGASGGGKSTLVRSIIVDILKDIDKDKKVLLWLSEESFEDFITEFSRMGFDDQSKLDQLHIISELSLEGEGSVYDKFERACDGKDIIILDNLTTSQMYEPLKPAEQGERAKDIKQIAERLQVPVVLIAHTGGLVTENMTRIIDQTDIRGAKGIVNISQFYYIMQSFVSSSFIFPTIRITKHRGQDVSHKLFAFRFNREQRCYETDFEISFNDFKERFKKRNKL